MNQLSLPFTFGSRRAVQSAPDVDEVRLEGTRVVVNTVEGATGEMPLSELIAAVQGPSLGPVCWPDGVKAALYSYPMLVCIVSLPAMVRQLKWIAEDSPAPYGKGCKYTLRRLSLPDMALFVPFAVNPCVTGEGLKLRATQRCEVYALKKPISTLDDPVFMAPLLNLSKYKAESGFFRSGKSGAWYCTQTLPLLPFDPLPLGLRIQTSIQALVSYLWTSAYNYSSETSPAAAAGGEEMSWFTYYVRNGIEPRIRTVEQWEAESRRDALVGTQLNLVPAGKTLKGVAQRILTEFNAPRPGISRAEDVARLVLNPPDDGDEAPVYPHALWPTFT
jgi:hypothetical protein